MTARTDQEQLAREGLAPIIVDLSDVESYSQMVVLARWVEQQISAMPLEGLAKMSRDASRMALLRTDVPADAMRELQRDRDILDALETAQRQLMKIRARYGG